MKWFCYKTFLMHGLAGFRVLLGFVTLGISASGWARNEFLRMDRIEIREHQIPVTLHTYERDRDGIVVVKSTGWAMGRVPRVASAVAGTLLCMSQCPTLGVAGASAFVSLLAANLIHGTYDADQHVRFLSEDLAHRAGPPGPMGTVEGEMYQVRPDGLTALRQILLGERRRFWLADRWVEGEPLRVHFTVEEGTEMRFDGGERFYERLLVPHEVEMYIPEPNRPPSEISTEAITVAFNKISYSGPMGLSGRCAVAMSQMGFDR